MSPIAREQHRLRLSRLKTSCVIVGPGQAASGAALEPPHGAIDVVTHHDQGDGVDEGNTAACFDLLFDRTVDLRYEGWKG